MLIAAFKGQPTLGRAAARVLEDTNRIFLSSPFVHLEVCPKAFFNRQRDEYAFYQSYFQRVVMTHRLKAILRLAVKEASDSGVGPMDSLDIAAAHLLRADEFITTETPNKSIHRASLVRVVYLFG